MSKESKLVQDRNRIRIRSAYAAMDSVRSAQQSIWDADGELADIGGEDVFPRAGEALWTVSEAILKLALEMEYVLNEVNDA